MTNDYSAVNTVWVLVATVLVFFMQAGFALLESGFTRLKNAGNIIMKNLMDFCIAVPLFLSIGFGLMYGKGVLIGTTDLGFKGDYSSYLTSGIPLWVFVMFQVCFCGTAATIISGAMAERTKFSAYCLCSVIMSALIYPICGHWIWGGGWLEQLGYHDFAGGTVVHLVGGMAAFSGAIVLGPRIGKYGKDGSSKAIPGHNLTNAALGMFILWFAWFGFNGGSTLGVDTFELGSKVGRIFLNTNLSAALSAVATMLYTWVRYKKPDVSLTVNGIVGGLVAATCGCDVMSLPGVAVTGIVTGVFLVEANQFIDKKLHVDDPVGAVGVHGGCGLLGTLMTGIFSQENGFLYGGGLRQFGIQCLGAMSVILFVGSVMWLVFKCINGTIGLRVPIREEITGLDLLEHGVENAYEGFMAASDITDYMPCGTAGNTSWEKDTIAQLETSSNPAQSDVRLTKVEIITKQSKFEELKEELNKIGITGITVSQVIGCGMQKGADEYYRGSKIEMRLLPKIKVEIVLAKVPLVEVVNTAKRVLYTGHVGDGKIFVYTVDNAIKVRTGEEGFAAMQDDD